MKAKEFLNQLKSLHEQMPYPAILFGDKIDNGKIVKTHWFAMFVDPKLDLVEIGLLNSKKSLQNIRMLKSASRIRSVRVCFKPTSPSFGLIAKITQSKCFSILLKANRFWTVLAW